MSTLTTCPNFGVHYIVPLYSTKSDVQKLLGTPFNAEYNIYDTQNERVTIWYSRGNCKEDTKAKWNVPKDTVLGMIISQKGNFILASLNADLSKFQRVKDIEMEGVYHYSNEDGSVVFDTRIKDNFEDIDYFVFRPSKNDKEFLCKDKVVK